MGVQNFTVVLEFPVRVFSSPWFFSSLLFNPHIPQVYKRMLLTSVSYKRSLVFIDVLHFFFHTSSLFFIAILDISFLLFVSSLSPSLDPSLITSLQVSSSFLPLFITVSYILSSFTSKLLSVSTFWAFL